jgi:membrane protease YdiL (CAAX protease family)
MDSVPAPIKSTASRSRWWIHLILITGYVLVIGIYGLGQRGTHRAMLSSTVGGLLWACVFQLLIFGLTFGLACFASHATRDDLLLRWRGIFRPVLLGIGYSVATKLILPLLTVGIAIFLIFINVISKNAINDFISTNSSSARKIVDITTMRDNPVYFWLTLTVVSFIVAGLREELWRSAFLAGMRSLWPQHFSSNLGQVSAVTICAIIFGFGHSAMGLLAVCLTGLLGLGLGLIMIFHKSIWPAVIAHGMFDATAMAMIPWVMTHN